VHDAEATDRSPDRILAIGLLAYVAIDRKHLVLESFPLRRFQQIAHLGVIEGRSAAATCTPDRTSQSVIARPTVTITAMVVGSGVALFASAGDVLTSQPKIQQPGRFNWRQATVFAATVVNMSRSGVSMGSS
jgi:hypothetical protein